MLQKNGSAASESRGLVFDPYKGHRVVSLNKTLPRVLVKTQESVAPSRHD